MRIDIATLFPDMMNVFLDESIIGRARRAGYIEIKCHDIRTYTLDKHRRVDDKPFGGGMGMVMQAQPIYDCIMDILKEISGVPRLIYMSPKGKKLTQETVNELAEEENLVLLCGHYEGIDQRVLDELNFEEISIGDYVVTGGEMPALILTDAVARIQPGVLPGNEAYMEDSHYRGLLEYPQFTRPEEWRGRRVPEVLLSGHHANIEKWRFEQSLAVTRQKRPDMYEKYALKIKEELPDDGQNVE